MQEKILEQDLKAIKNINFQFINGYHISNSDYERFQESIVRILELKKAIKAERKI